ncbi:hypothetical protein HDU76_006172, partial [Blyttiomyces sp. JEL0837]
MTTSTNSYIPLDEAFDDTPLFRDRVREEIDRIKACSDHIDKITQTHKELSRIGSEWYNQRQLLISQLATPLFDEKITGPLTTFREALTDIEERRRSIFSTQIDTVLIQPLLEFQQQEIAEVLNLNKKFEQADLAHRACVEKFLTAKSDSKRAGTENAGDDVANSKLSLHKLSIELGEKLNKIRERRALHISESALAFIYTEMALHYQSYDVLSRLQPIMDALAEQLKVMREQFEARPTLELSAMLAPLELYNPNSPR